MASVEFAQVTKRFETYTAVRNLNLTVADQDFLVLVGPSGCGKTTSLRMLAGLESVTGGHIYIDGQRVNAIPAKDRNIAMVFQSYALYPHLSVYENMAFSLQIRRTAKAEIDRRVRAAARQMGIEPLLQRKPKELSGGQRQRVAVCRALVRNPAVFLMDEPLSNLDAKLRVQARAEISLLHQTLGSTFIYVTHDQIEAMTMGTRIAVMNQGILQQVDTPSNLYTCPANRFVAEFIGSPAMNSFKATLVEKAGTYFVKTAAFQLKLPQPKMSEFHGSEFHRYVGREVRVGIRPESIYDPTFAAPGIQPEAVKATVAVREMMGNEIILHLKTVEGQNFVARVDRRSPLSVGESASLLFDMASSYLFDPQTESLIISFAALTETTYRHPLFDNA